MKTAKKSLLLVLCAVLLVVSSVLGTMAYLTSEDRVTNTFTVGKVAITLDETAVNPDGTPNEESGSRVKENTYKLLPGHTYTKDPIVHVDAASEKCWIFVKVENNIKEIEDQGTGTIAAQMEKNGWTSVEGETNVYAYKDMVQAGANVPVFANFTVDETLTNSGLAEYAGAKIDVTAYAVQADGFDTAEAAWTAAGF